jgi:putative ABC transport system ATP-binding protein
MTDHERLSGDDYAVPEGDPLVRLRGVCHSFGSGVERRQVLKEVSLDLAAGEVAILAGPSGCGKTTLLTLVGALRASQQGEVHVLGQTLHGMPESDLVPIRRRIGFIFQAHNLLPFLTARQNVEMSLQLHPGSSRRERAERAGAMLESVGLAGRIDAHPAQLSGGQKQRVSIARALAARPELVLADEPTSALDRQTGRDIVEILRDLARRQGTAILLVTHDNRITDIADRILEMDDGRIVRDRRTAGATLAGAL